MGWAYAWSTAKGAVHTADEECQDFAICATSNGVLIAVLADGAGSTKGGGIGARAACMSFVRLATSHSNKDHAIDSHCFLEIFGLVVNDVRRLSNDLNCNHSDLASTLVGVICEPDATHISQIGDGAAVVRRGEDWTIPVWPAETEFVNTTHFVTSANALDSVQIQVGLPPIDELVMFSDGLQHLVLDAKSKEPHLQFFHSVSERFNPDSSGEDKEMGAWLSNLLRSPGVVNRTDDDTSILVARRHEH